MLFEKLQEVWKNTEMLELQGVWIVEIYLF